MCMMFHMATKINVPKIEWNKDLPAFNISDLSEENKDVLTHFNLPYVSYVGSDESCGCGFKHALRQDGLWLPVIGSEDSGDGFKNQRQLFDFINDNLIDQEFIEIYGCWDGDFAEPSEDKQEIELNDLLDPEFYFKERGLYIVKIKNNC